MWTEYTRKSFNWAGGQANLNAQIKDFSTKMEKIKAETSERVNKIRQETATALEKLGKAVKKEEPEE